MPLNTQQGAKLIEIFQMLDQRAPQVAALQAQHQQAVKALYDQQYAEAKTLVQQYLQLGGPVEELPLEVQNEIGQ